MLQPEHVPQQIHIKSEVWASKKTVPMELLMLHVLRASRQGWGLLWKISFQPACFFKWPMWSYELVKRALLAFKSSKL